MRFVHFNSAPYIFGAGTLSMVIAMQSTQHINCLIALSTAPHTKSCWFTRIYTFYRSLHCYLLRYSFYSRRSLAVLLRALISRAHFFLSCSFRYVRFSFRFSFALLAVDCFLIIITFYLYRRSNIFYRYATFCAHTQFIGNPFKNGFQ